MVTRMRVNVMFILGGTYSNQCASNGQVLHNNYVRYDRQVAVTARPTEAHAVTHQHAPVQLPTAWTAYSYSLALLIPCWNQTLCVHYTTFFNYSRTLHLVPANLI